MYKNFSVEVMNMPGVYAHYRFGKQVLSQLSPKQRQCVTRFRRLYDMGLYGGDIFAFYNPLMQTDTGKLEESYHSQTGIDFFSQALTQATTEGAQAYLYGVLAHYCLDSLCKAYLQRQKEAGACLSRLDADFDSCLLTMDGLELPYDLSRHMELTRGECVTVSQFYPPATARETHSAIRHMTLFYRFLAGKNQKRVRRVLSLLGNARLQARIFPAELPYQPSITDQELMSRYNRAAKLYPDLLKELTRAMEQGTPLGGIFKPTFR